MNTTDDRFTVDAILDAMKLLPTPAPSWLDPRPFSFGGFNLLEAPSRPVIELREDIPVSDEFRNAFNLWLLGRFGTRSSIPKDYVYIMPYLGSMIA